MHVIVQKPPVFLKTPHNLYLRKLGETVEMTCDARDGEDGHKPMVVWYKVSNVLEVNLLIYNHVITKIHQHHYLVVFSS